MFLVTLIPGVLAACSIVVLVREKQHEPSEKQTLWQGVRALPNDFRRYLVGVGIAGIGDFSKTLLILWATQAWSARFGLARAATLAMTFYIGYNIVYTVSCYVSGLLADHFPKNWVLAIGYSVAVGPATALMLPGDSLGQVCRLSSPSPVSYMGVWETVGKSAAATLLPRTQFVLSRLRRSSRWSTVLRFCFQRGRSASSGFSRRTWRCGRNCAVR